MNVLVMFVITFLAAYLIAFVVVFLRLSVRHTQKDERIVYLSNPFKIKILGPGWVMANPFRGRLLLVSLEEQNCQTFVDEKATMKIGVSYRIIDIEKAVTIGIRYALYVLENAKISEKAKEKIRQRGFGPVMKNIKGLVANHSIWSFKALPENYGQDVMQFKNEINEICKAQIQKALLKEGIKINHVEIMLSV
jgi:hypothetical protein